MLCFFSHLSFSSDWMFFPLTRSFASGKWISVYGWLVVFLLTSIIARATETSHWNLLLFTFRAHNNVIKVVCRSDQKVKIHGVKKKLHSWNFMRGEKSYRHKKEKKFDVTTILLILINVKCSTFDINSILTLVEEFKRKLAFKENSFYWALKNAKSLLNFPSKKALHFIGRNGTTTTFGNYELSGSLSLFLAFSLTAASCVRSN